MKIEIKPDGVLVFCKKNWFQITLVLLGLYFFLIKDMSLNIHVQTPDKAKEKPAAKSREKFTDALTEQLPPTDRMEVPFIGTSSGSSNNRREYSTLGESVKQAFLKRFAKVAVEEQKKFGIPASVILATALYQSFAGKSELANKANNFFNLPCAGDWSGNCVDFQDQRYRRYATAWESFRDFSLFTKANFPALKGKNFKAWAKGLEQSGIFGNGEFAAGIIDIIQQYGLSELDR